MIAPRPPITLLRGLTVVMAILLIGVATAAASLTMVLRDANITAARISADGRFIVIATHDPLLPGDPNSVQSVYAYEVNTGNLERVSLGLAGAEPNGDCYDPTISADGRYVGFLSSANNLVPNDVNGVADAFVYDRQTQRTIRLGELSAGFNPDDAAAGPVIFSADGSVVAFTSNATNLVAGFSAYPQVYVQNLQTGAVEPVNESSSGELGNGSSHAPSISADGSLVAYETHSSNYLPAEPGTYGFLYSEGYYVHDRATGLTTPITYPYEGGVSLVDGNEIVLSEDGTKVLFTSEPALTANDINNAQDVYLRDLTTGATELISVALSGAAGRGSSYLWDSTASDAVGQLSADGRYAVFTSEATNLTADAQAGVFVRDRLLGQTRYVAVSDSGAAANVMPVKPTISADGRLVLFYTGATNLFPAPPGFPADLYYAGLVLADAGTTLDVTLSGPPTGVTLLTGVAATISADLVNPVGAATVTFSANGTAIGTVSTPPFNLSWTPPAKGLYLVSATATDSAGNTSTVGKPVAVIDPGTDSTQPSTDLFTDVNTRQFASGAIVPLTAAGTDPTGGLQTLQVYANGIKVAEFTGLDTAMGQARARASFLHGAGDTAHVSADTRRDAATPTTEGTAVFTPYKVPAADKLVELVTVALNALGQARVSSANTITVVNDATKRPLDAAITSPADGGVIRRGTSVPITVQLTANDAAAIDHVDYYANKEKIASLDGAAELASFVANALGRYVLTAIGHSANGLSTVSAPIVVDATDTAPTPTPSPTPAPTPTPTPTPTPSLPTVTVAAAGDAEALGGGRKAKVVFTRSGGLTGDLTVRYKLAGSARNGVDYKTLGTSVVIPAGRSSVTLKVKAINDAPAQGNRLIQFKLVASATDAYVIGTPRKAIVNVIDND